MVERPKVVEPVETIETTADLLEKAASSGVAIAPLDLPAGDIEAAYRVQSLVTSRRLAGGARIVGHKIGLTSEAIQRQVGVDRPDFGVLFDDMRYADGEVIPIGRLLQPRCEAEVAFVLSADIVEQTDAAGVRAAVGTAYAALEIVDSRIADWRIAITDTVADNASSGVFVLASQGLPLSDVEPIDVTMSMTRNGSVVSEGNGRACLGDPLNALAWLANTAIEVGTPLRAGHIVLSGALGPMIAVEPGDVFTAEIAPLGTVTARFSERTTA